MVNEGKFVIGLLNCCRRGTQLDLQDFIWVKVCQLIVILRCLVCDIDKQCPTKYNGKFSEKKNIQMLLISCKKNTQNYCSFIMLLWDDRTVFTKLCTIRDSNICNEESRYLHKQFFYSFPRIFFLKSCKFYPTNVTVTLAFSFLWAGIRAKVDMF